MFLLLLACGGASDKTPTTFDASSDKGMAIGTITFEGDAPRNDIYRFFYSPVSGDKKFIKKNDGKIQILGRAKDSRGYNGDFNNKQTYLFVIEREPGNYAFTEYNYLTHIGYSGMVNNSRKFAIPFEVKKGEVAYIGEFTYVENAEPGIPRIIVSNNMARDLPEFKKKYQGINWDMAGDKTVKTGDTGNGLVDFR